jgi:hypothetical protein
MSVSNLVEHSAPWKATSHSASKEISRILWNQIVDYYVYKTVG